jgi:hypothetical protein
MRSLRHVFLAIVLCACASRSYGGTLYASSAAGGPGELYILNSATGAMIQDVGPLVDANSTNYPVTGLAFDPTTGVLYGSTGNSQIATEALLISINPSTGLVTPIGSFNAGPTNTGGDSATMADIGFDAAGNLYGVGSIGGPQLYSISKSTGQATVIGSTGLTSTAGGGLAISSAGVFYGTPTSARFGTYDTGTGAFTNIANPTKPVGGAYASLDFDGGVLYGLDLGPDSIGKPTELVTFNTATGAIANLGASVAQLDAIAFQVPEPTSILLCLVAVLAGLVRSRR